MSIPIVLVAGFLGAGKTTLMRRLIFDAKARGLRACVIVNEYGAADVDSHVLKAADAELIASIEGGCACCSGQDELHETLLELALRPIEQRPDVVLLEASGLADPVLLLDGVTSPALLSRVRMASIVGVADVANWDAMGALGPLLQRQLALADVVVLNKLDLAGNDAARVEAAIRQDCPRAFIAPAIECDFDLRELWARTLQALDAVRSSAPTDKAIHRAHTVVCPLPHPIERTALEGALSQLLPEVWRAKGFVRLRGEAGLWLVQFTGGGAGRFRLSPFYLSPGDDEPDTFVVFLGAALDEEALRRAFDGIARPMI